MNFRDFLHKQILNLVRHNRENINYLNQKTEIFFFQIGCFPSSPSNNNHECPPLLLDCLHQNVNVNLICIDPEYHNFLDNTLVRDRIQSYPFPVYIYENVIEKEDYTCLVEFCHFISNFSCLSIINETTGIVRPHFYNPTHQTNYLYISPSICEANLGNSIYNPILDFEIQEKINFDSTITPVTNYYWKTYKEEEILYELYKNDDPKLNNHVEGIINYYLDTEINIYLKILHYMHQEPAPQFPKCELKYEKNYGLFYVLENHLYYRLPESKIEIKAIIKKFQNSDYQNLEIFIKKKIYFILLAKLVFKFKGNTDLISQHNNYIIFESNTDIRNNVQWLKQN